MKCLTCPPKTHPTEDRCKAAILGSAHGEQNSRLKGPTSLGNSGLLSFLRAPSP